MKRFRLEKIPGTPALGVQWDSGTRELLVAVWTLMLVVYFGGDTE